MKFLNCTLLKKVLCGGTYCCLFSPKHKLFFSYYWKVLCFGFLAKTSLAADEYFEQCLHSSPAFPAPHSAPTASKLGRTQPEELTQRNHRDAPCLMTSWQHQKLSKVGSLGKEPLLGHFLAISLLVRGGERLPLHHLLCQAFFSLFPSLIKLFLLMSFLAFAFLIVPPHSAWGGVCKWLCDAQLLAHHTCLTHKWF